MRFRDSLGDFHHPDAEEIGPGLHAVLAEPVAGGIPGSEDDAEVEHGWGKENVRLYDDLMAIDFPACSGQESHGRNQGKEAIRPCGFLYKSVADPLRGLEDAPLPESI